MTKFQSDVMDKINNCKDPETALMAVVKVVDEFLRAEGIDVSLPHPSPAVPPSPDTNR